MLLESAPNIDGGLPCANVDVGTKEGSTLDIVNTGDDGPYS